MFKWIEKIAGVETIRGKLIFTSIVTSGMLAIILVLMLFSFSVLQGGFQEVIGNANKGVGNAEMTQDRVSAANAELEKASGKMAFLSQELVERNMLIQILAKNINKLAATQKVLQRDLEILATKLPEGDLQIDLENIGDTLDLNNSMLRREGLLILRVTEESLNAFSKEMSSQSEVMTKLSQDLQTINALSGDVLTANQSIQAQTAEFSSDIVSTRNLVFVFVLLAIVTAIISSRRIMRSVLRPLENALTVTERIAEGDLSGNIATDSRDEFGRLMLSMRNMQSQLKKVIEEDIQSLIDAASQGRLDKRINTTEKQGCYKKLSVAVNQLVQVSEEVIDDTTTMFKALANGQLNQRIKRSYNGSFDQLKQDANSTADKIQSIVDVEIKQLVQHAKRGDLEQRIPLAQKEGFFYELSSGVNELVATFEEVVNEAAFAFNRLAKGDLSQEVNYDYEGRFGQLRDDANATIKKLKVVIESDIEPIVQDAAHGDLSVRIELRNKEGFYRQISAGINKLVDTNDKVLRETTKVLEAMAEGDLSQSIQSDYEGAFLTLKYNINKITSQLRDIIQNQIQGLVNQAKAGDLSSRINTEGQAGAYLALSWGINELVNVSDKIIEDSGRALMALAEGDLSKPITNQYEGSFNTLKEGINSTIRKLTDVIEQDVQSIVDSAKQGDLNNRIDLHNKQGFFSRLSESINELVAINSQVIEDMLNAARSMSEGDLTFQITNEYQGQFNELKNTTNATTENLRQVIGSIRNSASSVGQASREIASGNANLSSRTETQASSIEETAASMEEITDKVRVTAEDAKSSAELTEQAIKVASKGGNTINHAIASMEQINESSHAINEIIGVIDEIAFQTNLLALNAAVEAARAGESGRGFAVVAGEVRNLAQRSAGAAKEIKELIGGSTARVDEGCAQVNEAGNILLEIITSVKRVDEAMRNIRDNAVEQHHSIEQVNVTISTLDGLTQQNAALVEEASAASHTMSDQAAQMLQQTDYFKVGS